MKTMKMVFLIQMSVCCLLAAPRISDMKEYWEDRLPPVDLGTVPWLARLRNEGRCDVYGCKLEASWTVLGELRISVRNTIPLEDRGESQLQYIINGHDVLLDDMVFNPRWHPASPIGVTLLFYASDGRVYGYSAELGYEYGWNGRILSSQATTSGAFLTLLRRGDDLQRVIRVGDLVDAFRKAVPQCVGKPGQFVAVVKVPLLGWCGSSLLEVDCLYQAVDIPFVSDMQK